MWTVKFDPIMDGGANGTWEYRTLRPPRGDAKKESEDPLEQLNELGAEGWEFVSTIEYVGGGTKYLVFKRPARGAGEDG